MSGACDSCRDSGYRVNDLGEWESCERGCGDPPLWVVVLWIAFVMWMFVEVVS